MYELENYWIIGDVHGCMFTLEKLIQKLPKEAIPIFIGDLVDRGNFSKEVMEFVLDNDYLAVFGNHEYLMFNYIRDAIFKDKHAMWSLDSAYGGDKSVCSYKNDTDKLLRHIKYIATMPKYIEIGRYFLTHGFGLPYYKRKDKTNCQMRLYTNRLENLASDWENDWDKYPLVNIFGHTPYEEVLFGPNYIGIDTGCAMGGKLSAIQLDTHKCISEATDKKDI